MNILKTIGAYIVTALVFAVLAFCMVAAGWLIASFGQWNWLPIDWWFTGRITALAWVFMYGRFLYDKDEQGTRNYKSLGEW